MQLVLFYFCPTIGGYGPCLKPDFQLVIRTILYCLGCMQTFLFCEFGMYECKVNASYGCSFGYINTEKSVLFLGLDDMLIHPPCCVGGALWLYWLTLLKNELRVKLLYSHCSCGVVDILFNHIQVPVNLLRFISDCRVD